MTISKEEQAKRLDERKTDVLKQWKIGPLDKKAQEKWNDYSEYIKTLFKNTGTKQSPWIEIETDNKKKPDLKPLKLSLTKSQIKREKSEDFVKIHN